MQIYLYGVYMCELGCVEAYHYLGNSYLFGTGIEQNVKKAAHHWHVAAMIGDVTCRHLLGNI